MPANSGTTAVDIARLQERSSRNQSDLQEVKGWVDELSHDVKDVKDVQNEQLVVLQKMETILDHMTDKLSVHDSHDIQIQSSVGELQLSHARVATKFKIVLAILGVIGAAIVGVGAKLLFFSPILN